MLNGAFFIASGAGASSSYAKASSLSARPSSLITSLTSYSGALVCKRGSRCWLLLLQQITHNKDKTRSRYIFNLDLLQACPEKAKKQKN